MPGSQAVWPDQPPQLAATAGSVCLVQCPPGRAAGGCEPVRVE